MANVVDCPSCGRKLRVPDELAGTLVRCPSCGHKFASDGKSSAAPPGPPVSETRPEAHQVPLTRESPPSPAEQPLPLNSSVAPGEPATLSLPPVSQSASEVPQAPLPPPEENLVRLSLDEHLPPRPRPQEPSSPPSPALPRKPAPLPPERPKADLELRPCPYCGERISKSAVRCHYCDEDLDDEDDRPWEHPGRFGVRRDWEPHRGTLVLVLGILSVVLISLCAFIGVPLGIAAWIMGHRDLRKMADNVMDPYGKGTTQAGWICGIIGTILCFLCSLGWLGYFGFFAWMMSRPFAVPPPRPAPPPPPRKFELPGQPLRLHHYLPTRS